MVEFIVFIKGYVIDDLFFLVMLCFYFIYSFVCLYLVRIVFFEFLSGSKVIEWCEVVFGGFLEVYLCKV